MIPKKSKNSLLKASYRWHRNVGLCISIPILLLVLSGLLLNHPKFFGLDSNFITSSTVLNWYGMEPKMRPLVLREEDTWAALLDGVLYLNGKHIAEGLEALTGLGELDEIITLSTTANVFLLDKSTHGVIDKLGSESLPPGRIIRSEVRNERLLLDTEHGRYVASADILGFDKDDRLPLEKHSFSVLSASEYQTILEDWRGRGLSLARVTRDLHSGRFFGTAGVFVVDLCALSLVFLICTGIYRSWKLK